MDKTFVCSDYSQPLDLDLVKVTINPGVSKDGMHLNSMGGDCTGTIDRIEVDTWTLDGIKLGYNCQTPGPPDQDGFPSCEPDPGLGNQGGHDLAVLGGYVNCRGRTGLNHQTGIQALGGLRITFTGVTINCPTSNNAAIFISKGAAGSPDPLNGDWPTDIVCDGCVLSKGSTSDQVVQILASIRSGVRNSTLYGCPDGTGGSCPGAIVVVGANAKNPIPPLTSNNTFRFVPQCVNTLDDDFEERIDHASDLGCSSSADESEDSEPTLVWTGTGSLGGSGSTSPSATLTTPTGGMPSPAVGDLLVAQFTWSETTTLTFTCPWNWLEDVSSRSLTNPWGLRQVRCYRYAQAGDGGTVTGTLSAARKWAVVVAEYKNVQGSPAAQASAFGISSTVSSGTASAAGQLLLGSLSNLIGSNQSSPTNGFVQRACAAAAVGLLDGIRSCLYEKVVSVPESAQVSATLPAIVAWAGAIATFSGV